MYYTMWLRVRGVLLWTAIVLGALYAFIIAVTASQGLLGAHPHGDRDTAPLPALFAAASFIAAIAASCLCALCDENDGHLPVVWTMPVSRARYAITTFAV